MADVLQRASAEIVRRGLGSDRMKLIAELAHALGVERARSADLEGKLSRIAYELGAERNPEHARVLAALQARLNEARAYSELVAGGCPHGCVSVVERPCPFHRRAEEVKRRG